MTVSSRPRAPGATYAVVVAAVMVFVATVAFTARPAPPPTVAEFAPQAVQQIKDAPSNQSSAFGVAPGGEGGTQATTATTASIATTASTATTTSTTLPPIVVPRVKRCVGDPPRQIEDPQSPPCIPYWDGDNGGATWRGVTRDSIDIMIPTVEDNGEHLRFYQDLERFFNARFQFYGRKLHFIYGRYDIGNGTADAQTQDAVNADEKYQVFASTFYRAGQGYYYHQELARRHVLSVTGAYFPLSAEFLSSYRPYLFSYLMPAEEVFANIGEWGCKRLAGKNAVHAGGSLSVKPRVFGIIQQTYYDADKTGFSALTRELNGCQASPAATARNEVRQGTDNDAQAAAIDPATSTQVILKMQQAGVTSIFCVCQLFTLGALQKAATNQGYFPEWMVSTYGPNDISASYVLGADPPEQLTHTFGLTFQPRQTLIEDEPFYWAAKEVDPSIVLNGDTVTVQNHAEIYRPLLLLASGIQLAGPNLTPQTFAKGLQQATFPNPDHPNMPGKVGFQPDRFGMTLDGAEFWWSNTARSPYAGDQGAVCYVDGGRRHTRGSWPAGGDPFFQPDTACDSGAR